MGCIRRSEERQHLGCACVCVCVCVCASVRALKLPVGTHTHTHTHTQHTHSTHTLYRPCVCKYNNINPGTKKKMMQRTKRALVQALHLQYSWPRTHFHVHHSHINTLTVGEAENRVRGRLTTFSIVHYYTVCALWLAAHISPLSLIFPSATWLAVLCPTHKY